MRFPSPSLLTSVPAYRSLSVPFHACRAANSRGDLVSECPYRVTGFDAIQDTGSASSIGGMAAVFSAGWPWV
jgi:hypothetical protein